MHLNTSQIGTDMETKIQPKDPWWVIVLKTLAYLIGLLLAGIGTASAAAMMNIV